MKQYITGQQLAELSKGGRASLSRWWVAKVLEDDTKYALKGDLPYLSIGQMIEFLDGHEGYPIQIGEVHKTLEWPKSDELCDALWEAVKEHLTIDRI